MNTISKHDRYRGALVGVLGGDVSLAPIENKKAPEIKEILARRGGLDLYDYMEPWKGKRKISAGHPTDDSELTAALAISLVECGGFEPANAFMKLRDFIHGNHGEPPKRHSYLTDGDAYGSGETLISALKPTTYEQSLAEFEAGNIKLLPSNGALMRCAPVALVHTWPGESAKLGREQSLLTHRNPESIVACSVYAAMLHLLVHQDDKLILSAFAASFVGAGLDLWKKPGYEHCQEACSKLRDMVSKTDIFHTEPTDADIWPHSGGALISLRIAVWACLHATSYVDGLERIARLGGDTDTYGAIAGGLLGARYGIEGIPKEWRSVLKGYDIMIDLADKLYELAHKDA